MQKYVIVLLIGIALGIIAALQFNKPKTIKEEIVVEKEKVVVEEKVVTVVKEIKKPDGTVITETTKTEDRSSVAQNEKKEKKLDLSYKKDYLLGYQKNLMTNVNSFSIHKEVINNVYLGVIANDKSEISVGISIAF